MALPVVGVRIVNRVVVGEILQGPQRDSNMSVCPRPFNVKLGERLDESVDHVHSMATGNWFRGAQTKSISAPCLLRQ